MKPRITLAALLLPVAVSWCSADPYRGARTTQVSRELRVVTRRPRADAYFAAVHGYQHALGLVDGRRADLFAALARSLGKLPNADRVDLEGALHDALEGAHAARVRVRMHTALPDEVDPRVDAWLAAVVAPAAGPEGDAAIDARFAEVERSVELTLTPDAGATQLAPVLEAIGAVVREAEATRRCMERLALPLPPVLADEAGARADAPNYAAEFTAAQTSVQSFHARATMYAQESARIPHWADLALNLSVGDGSEPSEELSDIDAGAPDEAPQSPPESGRPDGPQP